MSTWFDPNVKFDPSNAQNWDTTAAERELAMRQALAKSLMQQMPQGQMVSGWYVRPSRGSIVANTLGNVAGAFMQARNAQEQSQIERADRDAMANALEMYRKSQDPTNYAKAAQEASPIPQPTFEYKNPQDVGPQLPGGPQTFAVRQPGQIQSTPLSEEANFAKSETPAAAPAQTVPGMVRERAALARTGPVSANEMESLPQAERNRLLREARAESDAAGNGTEGDINRRFLEKAAASVATRQAAPAPAAPTAPAQPPSRRLARPVAQVPAGPTDFATNVDIGADPGTPAVPSLGDTFNLVKDPSPQEQQAALQEQRRLLSRSMQDDRSKAIGMLARTRSGAKIAENLIAREFSPAEYDFQKVKLGDEEVLVAVNKRNPTDVRQITQPSGAKSVAERRLEHDIAKDTREAGTKSEERSRSIAETLSATDYAIRQIDEVLPMVGAATGISGKVSNAISRATGISTDSAIATERLESIKGGLLSQAMRMTKEQAGSAAGLSQQESQALQKSIASLDPRVGEAELTKQLNEVKRQFRMYRERMAAARDAVPQVPGTAPTQSTPSAPSGNVRVPGRGQRVTGPEDFGF